jgi:4'-phosphopantetheinyl transferase EntD
VGVARTDELSSLGLDAEPHAPLPDGVLGLITNRDELGHLAELERQHTGICWDRLLFSAKESIYKAWYPLTGRWLGFKDAQLRMDVATGSFTAALLVEGPNLGSGRLRVLDGRWLVGHDLVLTAVAVPAPGRPADRSTMGLADPRGSGFTTGGEQDPQR